MIFSAEKYKVLVPDTSGDKLISVIKDSHPDCEVVMLTAFKELNTIFACFEKKQSIMSSISWSSPLDSWRMSKIGRKYGHLLGMFLPSLFSGILLAKLGIRRLIVSGVYLV